MKDFYYRAIKQLLRVKPLVDKEKFLQLALGMNFDDYYEASIQITITKANITSSAFDMNLNQAVERSQDRRTHLKHGEQKSRRTFSNSTFNASLE